MSMVRASPLRLLVGLVALFAFSADVLDEISDRAERVQCSQTSQAGNHQNHRCPNCGCQNHAEAAVITDVAASLNLRAPKVGIFELGNELVPTGPPASIDHPPQLV
jgi:hypothetical protein